MNINVLSKNLKKLRLQKNLTQERVADILCVNTQTISRWECGITLPDAMMLPKIAKLYCVSIDDLYKSSSSAYDNYFQRLVCIYHETANPEDFLDAVLEFKKMSKTNSFSMEDMRLYGQAHQFMMANCINTALTAYNNVIDNKEKATSDTYKKAKCSKADILATLSNTDGFIAEQYKIVKNNPNNLDEIFILLKALCYSKEYKKAYDIFEQNKDKFEHAFLYSIGGEICCKLNITEKAFEYWDKAIELDDGFSFDVKFSKAFYLEKLEEWEKAYALRRNIANELRIAENDIEAKKQEELAERCLKKFNKIQ